MEHAAALARMRARRESWVDLEQDKPGLAVLLRRPAETTFPRFFQADESGQGVSVVVGIADVQQHVVGWRGFTEATLYGAADGGSDVVEFAPALWAELVADSADWSSAVSKALAKVIADYIKSKADAAKN